MFSDMSSTQLPRSTQVLVVGGGPAGSATAWFAARAGLDVVLLDRAQFPRAKPCAEYVSPEGARLLSMMGALETLESQAAALTGMVVHAPAGGRIHGEFAAAHGFHGFRDRGLGIRREVLDSTLLECARRAGVQVIERAKVEQLTMSNGRVTGVVFRHAQQLVEMTSNIVIGADGLRSIVSRRLGLAAHASWPRRIALVSHYRGITGMTSLGEMHVTRDRGYVGLAAVTDTVGDAVGDAITNVAVVMPQSLAATALRDGPEAALEQWMLMHPQLAERMRHATRVSPVLATGPFASRARRAWAPGAALVGDAADFFDPFTGEGIFAALRGAEILAPFVESAVRASARGDATGALLALRAYERARHDAFAGKWRVERLIGAAVSAPRLLDGASRVLGSDRSLADLLIGVTGDFVPPSALVAPTTLWRLARAMLRATGRATRRAARPSFTVSAPTHVHRS